MRDLRKILDSLSNQIDMEYCEEFDEIKSAIEYCHKHVKPLNKLHFRSGNQPVINELTNRLKQILVNHEYVRGENYDLVPEAHNKLRKILMFLMANTDATYKYNLREDINLMHIAEVCPLMPKFLLVALVWELQLDVFFYELLSYASSWFTFQYFEAANDSLKYIEDPYAILQKVEGLARAALLSLTRIEMRPIDTVDRKIICGKLYDATIDLFRQFYTPDAEKLKHFSKNSLKRYCGFVMQHLLRLTIFFFDVYEGKCAESFNALNDLTIYNVCSSSCPFVNTKTISDKVKEQQMKHISALLNSLQYNLLLVKLDDFIYWVEIDINENLTMQKYIGDLAYQVQERMLSNPAFAHDLSNQIKMIAIEPESLSEKAERATIGEILNSIDNTDRQNEKQFWINVLLDRSVALGNEECLQTIEDNIQLITVDYCKKILNHLKLQLLHDGLMQKMDTENIEDMSEMDNITLTSNIPADVLQNIVADERLTQLVLMTLPNFSSTELLHIMKYALDLFGANCKIFCQSPIDFMQRSNNFFNKHNSIDHFDLMGFLKLCFEHPHTMWQQYFQHACNKMEHLKAFCYMLQQAPVLAEYFVPNLMHETIADEEKLQQPFVAQLLCEIYFIIYHPNRHQDYFSCLNKHIALMSECNNFAGLRTMVMTINKIAKTGETQSHKPLNFGQQTAPILLSVALIMKNARWNLVNYTEERHEVVCECIDFIQYTNKHFLPAATQSDRKWITTSIKDIFPPEVQFYLQKYALSADERPKDFDQMIITEEIKSDEQAIQWFLVNMARCTKKETEWLSQNMTFQPHIFEAILLLSKLMCSEEKPVPNVKNFRRCIANFSHIIKKIILPNIQDNTKKLEELLFQVLNVIAALPSDIFNETFLSILWLPLEIVEIHIKNMNFELYKRIISFMEKVTECKAKSLFCEKIESLISK